jgi:hypothetical protein
MLIRRINLILYPVFLLILFSLLGGCSTGKSSIVTKKENREKVQLIAVFPVQNGTFDQQASSMLRDKVLNALYFKGYPKIPTQLIDEKLDANQSEDKRLSDKAEYSRILGGQMKVDAVLYCNLKESRTAYYFIYSPMSVSAVFELRSAKTGRLLWKNQYSTIKRNYGISRDSLRLKASQDYESAVQELVDKAIESFPDGSDGLTASIVEKNHGRLQ